MKKFPEYFFLALTVTSITAVTVNETSATLQNTTDEFFNETSPPIASSRKGRHIIQERIELPINPHTKKQVIKIPSTISKVKLVQPPLNLRHSRGPQQFKNFPPHFRPGNRWNKIPPLNDFELDYFDLSRRTLKRPIVKEVSPEEFYRDEYEDEEVQEKRKRHPGGRVVKVKRKKKPNVLSDYLTKYESDDRPNYDEGGRDEQQNRYEHDKQASLGHGTAASTIHMKQVPPPVFSQNREPYPFENSHDNFIPELNIKGLPKGRQVQSIFSQQYTTHNPWVTTNLGLNEFGQFRYGSKGSVTDAKPYEISTSVGRYSQPDVAASEQIMTSLPVMTPGIKVIQPPVFRDVTVSHPSPPSRLVSSSQSPAGTATQKATIKDILEQDCPSYDRRGYCESPPRYPMHQIKSMIKKCESLMEVMNTQPFDEPEEVFGVSRRSDEAGKNSTESEEQSNWSRSASDESTACGSNLALSEPGYAREVDSGRWFVIVQHPDTIIQRIATDTCRNPGKSCRGLHNLKCTKLSVSEKSTSCVQRYTYQRLISWDPESPEGCPRMRVFRFPSACVCHLGVV